MAPIVDVALLVVAVVGYGSVDFLESIVVAWAREPPAIALGALVAHLEIGGGTASGAS